MTVLEEACRLHCEQWVDSFPQDIPEHTFTRKHERKMNGLIDKMRGNKRHRLTKKTIRAVLVAAVILSLATAVLANTGSKEFTVEKFPNYSIYSVVDAGADKKVSTPRLRYIPDGFLKTDEIKYDYTYYVSYEKGEKEFSVAEFSIDGDVRFDTEQYDSEIIEMNGVTGVYFRTSDTDGGIIFNNGDYIFIVSGNIGKAELVNIAQNIK